MKILLTGATGFIGSHLAEELIANGYELMIVKRKLSSLQNLSSILSSIKSIDSDSPFWVSQACLFHPDIIIHSAWSGVVSQNRDDFSTQLINIEFVNKLLFIADKCNSSKFIGLGSQAEYGKISKKVSEEMVATPITSYGAMKMCICSLIKSYCELRNINWYWLRVFAIYGERETEEWLLPSVIKKALLDKTMNFTLGEQKYAYLYIKDLARAVLNVCEKVNGKKGIYNISSSKAIEIRKVLLELLEIMNSKVQLNFGTIPYRENQSMHIEGDSSKFIKEFGVFEYTQLSDGLEKIINFYKREV